ncbi:atherin-like [Mustela erminea]|uniref:atherin-like n=1 Tax=Mustela erminea TaxID=36723 RepID=UPI001386D2E2|nr:atherin-like [Mustela erminea]
MGTGSRRAGNPGVSGPRRGAPGEGRPSLHPPLPPPLPHRHRPLPASEASSRPARMPGAGREAGARSAERARGTAARSPRVRPPAPPEAAEAARAAAAAAGAGAQRAKETERQHCRLKCAHPCKSTLALLWMNGWMVWGPLLEKAMFSCTLGAPSSHLQDCSWRTR